MKQKLLFVCLLLCSLNSYTQAQQQPTTTQKIDRGTRPKVHAELPNQTFATLGCNTNTTTCVPGTAGPFNFQSGASDFYLGCLDGWGGRYGYILLNIATTGPLQLLVTGNSPTGFIDVSVFNIPPGVSPCTAVTNGANLIACNFASSASGCTQFGNSFPCGSSVPAPNVVAGSQIMIIAEDWSSSQTTFTIQLGPTGAQTNPPDATINALPPICINEGTVQLTAVSNGGVWSGPGVSATGMFNPQTAGLGTHTVSYSIGVAPCASSDTQTFTVVESPSVTATSNEAAICYGGTLEFTATATPGTTFAWTGPGGWTSTQLNPSRTNVGPTANGTYTFTATLPNGCSESETVVVDLATTGPPVVVTQNISVNLDAAGTVAITPEQLDNGSSDCGIVTRVLSQTNFTCANIGANSVTLTLTDASGNSSSGTATVTVNDNAAPTVVTQNIAVNLDAAGVASITPAQIDNGSSDNCGIASMVLDQTTFNCTQNGANTVTLTVTDVNGNSSTGTATVTVNDTTAPIVVTQNISVNLDPTGTVTITPAQIDNGSSDNCAIDSMLLDRTTFDCTQLGTHTVTLTVTDINGNSSTGAATVTVNDTTAPAVVTQGISVNLGATGTVSITPSQIDNGSSDNCAIDTVTLDVASFTCTQVGANTVTLTVTDVNGNSATGTATVTVNDNIAPTVITQNITVSPDASGSVTITPAQIDNGSSDNCGIASMALNQTTFNCTQNGANTVTLTVTDVNGNSATGTATVTVSDTVAPIASTQNISVNLDATGTVTITPAQIDNGSSDNCAIDTLTLDVTSFDCTQVGANTVVLTVTDFSGNVSTGTATVTVNDTTPPTAVTQNISVNLDATGAVSITPSQIDNGSSDNCAVDTVTLDATSFTCTQVGANTVTMTVTDIHGNSATGTATVTVNDNIAPTVITQNISVNLDATGTVTITPSQIDNGSSDNCAIDTMTLDVTSFNCTQVGAHTVTLTVTDVNGNSATGTATVTVNDTTPPTVVTQNISVNLDATGTVTITPSQIDNGSSDNCAVDTITLDIATLNCTQVGANTVTLTVTDVNGNSANGTATVTVNDTTPPTVVTQNISVNLDATGAVSITASQIDNGSSDNCAVDTMILDVTSFNCTQVGANTVTLTVTDVNGNSATGTATVTVNDTTPPTVVTQNISVNLDATGTVTITPSQIDNGSSDNCAVDTMALDIATFNCAQVGANTVTLTVTDVNGNSATGTATVTVIDNLPPTAIAIPTPLVISLATNGHIGITADQIDAGSADNCGIRSMTVNPSNFGCGTIGSNTVTLTVMDFSGNVSTATATVEVTPIPMPTVVDANPVFCKIDQPTVDDLGVIEGQAVFFNGPTTTQPLPTGTVLSSGTYYVALRYGSCVGIDRLAINVTVNDESAPTGDPVQYLCIEDQPTVEDIKTNETDVIWYSSLNATSPVAPGTIVETNQTYYASRLGLDCESSDRLAVQVVLRYCDVLVHNAVTPNGDGKNDVLTMRGLDNFPDNQLQIFNRWGSLVYEAKNYGTGAWFTGHANKGPNVVSGTQLLPQGTYFYIFAFVNHDGVRQTKSGYIHLTY